MRLPLVPGRTIVLWRGVRQCRGIPEPIYPLPLQIVHFPERLYRRISLSKIASLRLAFTFQDGCIFRLTTNRIIPAGRIKDIQKGGLPEGPSVTNIHPSRSFMDDIFAGQYVSQSQTSGRNCRRLPGNISNSQPSQRTGKGFRLAPLFLRLSCIHSFLGY